MEIDAIQALRWGAAALTIVAATLCSWGANARQMALSFVLFSLAAAAWVAAGMIQGLPAITLQNAVLLTLNLMGVWRWGTKARAERTERSQPAVG